MKSSPFYCKSPSFTMLQVDAVIFPPRWDESSILYFLTWRDVRDLPLHKPVLTVVSFVQSSISDIFHHDYVQAASHGQNCNTIKLSKICYLPLYMWHKDYQYESLFYFYFYISFFVMFCCCCYNTNAIL